VKLIRINLCIGFDIVFSLPLSMEPVWPLQIYR
jgi:hypothetical protein